MTHYTKGTPSPASASPARPGWLKSAPTACRRPVSGTLSLPSSGCFSPFPHGTSSLSVSKEYLAFEGGPPIFRQDFTCPALLDASDRTSRTGLSPSLPGFSNPVPVVLTSSAGPRSLATTSGVSVDFLSSGYLRCFSSPGSLRKPYEFRFTIPVSPRCRRTSRQERDVRWVPPFGDPRIEAYSRLPVAYRRVSRPSSPLAAKASTKRPFRA